MLEVSASVAKHSPSALQVEGLEGFTDEINFSNC
jgi:hypothetical protein